MPPVISFGTLWDYAWPVAGLVVGLSALYLAASTSVRDLPGPRGLWLVLPMLLILTGDAAVGEGRPVLERVAKGTVAVLVAISVAVVVRRRRRHRAEAAR